MEAGKDALKTVDRKVSDKLVDGIEAGRKFFSFFFFFLFSISISLNCIYSHCLPGLIILLSCIFFAFTQPLSPHYLSSSHALHEHG